MSSNTVSRTVHLSNLPFEGNKADFEKYKQAIAEAFKTFDYEDAHITDKVKEGKTLILAHVVLKTEEAARKALEAKVVNISGKQVIV